MLVLDSMDMDILQRCLDGKPRGWEDFVDRFISMVTHVVNCTAQSQGVTLLKSQQEELIVKVFSTFHEENFQILRQLNGQNHLSTYLTIVTRRIVVKNLMDYRSHQAAPKIPA
ncbi:MAG: hypothetical protein LBQ54_00455 [Planctomycetaceae bacterium]|jgi:RNA polymerase sigma-70 factor (ECF subfamily)|nr:hypothetical protein [Planctomycetaceae bacterium]